MTERHNSFKKHKNEHNPAGEADIERRTEFWRRTPHPNGFILFFYQEAVIAPHLECQVSIFMHAKDLRVIYDWETLDVFLVFHQLI